MTRNDGRRKHRRLTAAELELEKAKVQRSKAAIVAAAVPASLLALWPTMWALAGRQTGAHLDVGLTVTASVVVAWGVTGELLRRSSARNRAEAQRNAVLAQEVVQLKGALQAAATRVRSVETDLHDVRLDADRLRNQLRSLPGRTHE